jgi:hypothetical protein
MNEINLINKLPNVTEPNILSNSRSKIIKVN